MIPSWTTLNNAVTDGCLGDPDIKDAIFQWSTHVGTTTTRDEINIKGLLRYLVGSPSCNMIAGCNLDVPGVAGTPQGSVLVMTDADRAGDVKDRRSYSGIAVWEWFPVKASKAVTTPTSAIALDKSSMEDLLQSLWKTRTPEPSVSIWTGFR